MVWTPDGVKPVTSLHLLQPGLSQGLRMRCPRPGARAPAPTPAPGLHTDAGPSAPCHAAHAGVFRPEPQFPPCKQGDGVSRLGPF